MARCVHHLRDGTRRHYAKEVNSDSVMFWAVLCWETLGPSIHVDVTMMHTTFLNQVHPFMGTGVVHERYVQHSLVASLLLTHSLILTVEPGVFEFRAL